MTEKKIITDFQKMTEIDVSKRIQQKGKFNYLSWSDAHELMKKHDPNAIISIREFEHWMVVKGERKEFLVSRITISDNKWWFICRSLCTF